MIPTVLRLNPEVFTSTAKVRMAPTTNKNRLKPIPLRTSSTMRRCGQGPHRLTARTLKEPHREGDRYKAPPQAGQTAPLGRSRWQDAYSITGLLRLSSHQSDPALGANGPAAAPGLDTNASAPPARRLPWRPRGPAPGRRRRPPGWDVPPQGYLEVESRNSPNMASRSSSPPTAGGGPEASGGRSPTGGAGRRRRRPRPERALPGSVRISPTGVGRWPR